MDYDDGVITIVELPEFIRRARRLLDDDERHALIDFLAAHPAAGILMPGTGGVRKLRWRRKGMGKSGGVRVVYFYYNEQLPVFLLTVFGKAEKSNLSKAERNELAKLTRLLVQNYGGRS